MHHIALIFRDFKLDETYSWWHSFDLHKKVVGESVSNSELSNQKIEKTFSLQRVPGRICLFTFRTDGFVCTQNYNFTVLLTFYGEIILKTKSRIKYSELYVTNNLLGWITHSKIIYSVLMC